MGAAIAPSASARAFTQLLAEADIPQLTWALGQVPRSLDIATNYAGDPMHAMFLSHETLIEYADDLELKPLLATSWSSPTLTKYVYRIRRGVKFWDGSPLTAADVVYSLNRNLDPHFGSLIASLYGSVARIRQTGASEVTVDLKHPDPLWQYVPALTPIMKESFAKPKGKNYAVPNTKIMATGPYILESFSSTQGITMTRNPNYWGPKPRVKTISFKFIEDETTRQLAMRSGEIDGTFQVSIGLADNWAKIPGVKVLTAAPVTVYFFSFDVSAAPWNDVHVRRAVAHCWDGVGFTKTVLHGRAKSANAMIAPALWSGLVGSSEVERLYSAIPSYGFSIDSAKAELAKSKQPHGFSASVPFPDSIPELGTAAVSLADNLKQIGIKLAVKQVPTQQWLNTIFAHKNLGMQAVQLYPDFPDPVDSLNVMYPSGNATPNHFNIANYRNKTIDGLLAQQARLKSHTQRAKDIAAVLRISGTDMPYLNLWWEGQAMAIRDKFTYRGFNAFTPSQQWIRDIS